MSCDRRDPKGHINTRIHDFWYTPHIGPWVQNLRSLWCMWSFGLLNQAVPAKHTNFRVAPISFCFAPPLAQVALSSVLQLARDTRMPCNKRGHNRLKLNNISLLVIAILEVQIQSTTSIGFETAVRPTVRGIYRVQVISETHVSKLERWG